MAPAASNTNAAAAAPPSPQQVAARRSAEDFGLIHWVQSRWDCQSTAQWTGFVAGCPAVVINKMTANTTHPGGWLVTVRGKGGSYHKSLSAAQEEAANVLAEVGEAVVGIFQFFADLVACNEHEEAEKVEQQRKAAAAVEAEKQQRKAAAAKVIATFDVAAFNKARCCKYFAAPVASAEKAPTKAKVKPQAPRPAVEPPRLLTPTPIRAKAEPTRSGIEDAILRVLAGTKQTDAEIALLIEQPVDLVRRHRLHLVKVKAVVETGKKGRSTLWSTAQ